MSFINLMRNKLKVKEVANALDANTSAVADINALIGSTPLPQGETITHLLANGAGGVNYSTEEVDTGQKWIDGKPIYQKTFTFSNLTITGWTNVITDSTLSIDRLISCEASTKTSYISASAFITKYLDGVISLYNGWGTDVDTITIRYTKNN